jgi:alpha-L-rhamnosidase
MGFVSALIPGCFSSATAAESNSPGASFKIERITVPTVPPEADANIRRRYEIEKAAWVWHPDVPAGEEAAVLFRNDFTLPEAKSITIHVSADQRHELTLDGQLISLGPDRGDLAHWSFASYKLQLPAGMHRMEALVAWIGGHAPFAQLSHRGGFILACEGDMAAQLNTGTEHWKTRRLQGWSFEPGPRPGFVGARQTIDGAKWFAPEADWVAPAVVFPPLSSNEYGIMRPGWRLSPSPLPDQWLNATQPGQVRAVFPGGLDATRKVEAEDCERARNDGSWNPLLAGTGRAVVPPHETVSVLIDLGNYFTAYPRLTFSGGRNSRVSVSWAEALFEPGADGKPSPSKGNRDEVAGKLFHGLEDTFLPDGGESRSYRTWWWRAGRYLLVTVRTADEPLAIDRFGLLESRYPLEDEGSFRSSDDSLNAIQPLLVRGMQMCSHETYMDCPYYEQLMYVGDTRLEILTTYAMTPDNRLPKRGIGLFDQSRSTWGMVAEHYPGRDSQLSPTFSLIWVSMIRDFAFWRDDEAFVKQCLPGMRGVLEQFRALRGPSGLLDRLPGWPFVDWVRGWSMGNAPDGVKGISSINNLFFVQSLRHAAEVEDAFGDPLLAKRNRELADELSIEIVKRFWVPERKLLADDEKHQHFSEHAQCLALLNGVLGNEKEGPCFQALTSDPNMVRTTVYFSFYLLETFRKSGRGDLILQRMEFWKELAKNGFKTSVESPEPSRSDCHAWGSHPLFHQRASLLGVRPASPGFREVEISPLPGGLRQIKARVPHPSGWIEARLDFDATGRQCVGEITLPPDTRGTFHWQGKLTELAPGKTTTIQTAAE